MHVYWCITGSSCKWRWSSCKHFLCDAIRLVSKWASRVLTFRPYSDHLGAPSHGRLKMAATIWPCAVGFCTGTGPLGPCTDHRQSERVCMNRMQAALDLATVLCVNGWVLDMMWTCFYKGWEWFPLVGKDSTIEPQFRHVQLSMTNLQGRHTLAYSQFYSNSNFACLRPALSLRVLVFDFPPPKKATIASHSHIDSYGCIVQD